jgi:hypothetical protein
MDMLMRLVNGIDHLSPALEFVLLPTGTKVLSTSHENNIVSLLMGY